MTDSEVAHGPWGMRGFTSGEYCGELAELSDPERRFLRSVPGLEPVWEWQWASDVEHLLLRCPLAPGHDGGHGTYVGFLPWRCRAFSLPGDFVEFDTRAREWYLVWGPGPLFRRVIAPMLGCETEKPATGRVQGTWLCGLWDRHPGDCKFHFVEEVEYGVEISNVDPSKKVLPDIPDDAFEALDVEVSYGTDEEPEDPWRGEQDGFSLGDEELDHLILGHYLSGAATMSQLAGAYYLDWEEISQLIDTRTTEQQRAEARRRRDRSRREYRRASEALWAAEWARMDAVAGQRVTRVAGRTVLG